MQHLIIISVSRHNIGTFECPCLEVTDNGKASYVILGMPYDNRFDLKSG